jgi:hypothetical protein
MTTEERRERALSSALTLAGYRGIPTTLSELLNNAKAIEAYLGCHVASAYGQGAMGGVPGLSRQIVPDAPSSMTGVQSPAQSEAT